MTIYSDPTQAQVPAAERSITLSVSAERTDVVLNRIAELASIRFSYNPAVIDPAKKVTVSLRNTPVREALYKVLGTDIIIRERKGYLILGRAEKTEPASVADEWMVFNGYVRNDSGAVILWVSVYDKTSLVSTVTSEYGYFSIRFRPDQLPLDLYFSKQGYNDTVLRIEPATPAFLQVTMQKPVPVSAQEELAADSLAMRAEGTVKSFFTDLENSTGARNIRDTLYRKFQVSLVPYAGTGGRLDPNIVSDYNLSLFGTYAMGIRKIGFSGMFSLVRGDVRSVQLSGFVNLVGGSFNGVQIAGFTNLVRQDVNGWQVAGFVNSGWGRMKGLQLAGFVNTSRKRTDGVQIAGFVNTSIDTMRGFQLSGFSNVARGRFGGTQVTGFANVVLGDMKGTQLGFVNVAGKMSGTQLGFFNYSDTLSGVAIGFMSFVNKGYHKIELSADEILPINIAFRSGTSLFYNILTAGINPFTDTIPLWNFGYGLGSATRLGKNTSLDLDLTCSQMVKGGSLEKINLVAKAYAGVDIRLGKKISLATGLTVNGHIYNSEYTGYPDLFSWYEPHIFYTNTWKQDHTTLDMWFGGKVGLRFL